MFLLTACSTTKTIDSCISNWEAKRGVFTKGVVVVQFAHGIGEDEAFPIIEKHGLENTWSYGADRLYYQVAVPVGEEFQWACKLQGEKSITETDMVWI